MLRRAAFHEAGHALLAHLNGASIDRVEVYPTPKMTVKGERWGCTVLLPGGTVTTRWEVRELLAGHAADLLSRGKQGRYPSMGEMFSAGSADDFIRAERLLDDVRIAARSERGFERMRAECMTRCWRETVAILRWKWTAVERLASALLKKGSLAGSELAMLIADA